MLEVSPFLPACDALELDAAFEAAPLLEIGDRALLRLRVWNGGADVADEVRVLVRASSGIALVSTALWLRGEPAGRELSFAMPGLLQAEVRELHVDVYAIAGGESHIDVRLECAQSACERHVTVLAEGRAAFGGEANRLELTASEAEAGAPLEGRIVLTNTGRGTATLADVRFEGDLDDLAVDGSLSALQLAPGERRLLRMRGRVPAGAADGAKLLVRAIVSAGTSLAERSEIRLGDAWIIARSRPRFEGTIESLLPAEHQAAPGERLDWRVRIANVGGARAAYVMLALHPGGAFYLPGSTAIERARLIDVAGTSPLWSSDGLRIEDVDAGQAIVLDVATLAERDATCTLLWARIICDGRETLLESPSIAVRDPGRSPRLPFVVRGAIVAGDEPVHKTPAIPAVRGVSRSPRAALEPAITRHLEALGGLMRHLWALAVLCADQDEDARPSAQLGDLRTALRSVFDRLSIKLRMPQYPIRADDVLDPTATHALTALGRAPSGVHLTTLGARLLHAASLIAAEGAASVEIAAYRQAFCTRLEALGDDAALIDALVVAQPVLDACLDAVLECEGVASRA